MNVELLFFPECPNVPAAREQLRRAFHELDAAPSWVERDISASDAPAGLSAFGSPTILVNGRDVMGHEPGNGTSCRIYPGSDMSGVPPLSHVVSALRAATPKSMAGTRSSVAVLPAVILSSLPVLSCPSCWPAYAGVLSALGVPFLLDTQWLIAATIAALGVSVAALGASARRRRRYGPVVAGATAAMAILVGKFVVESEVVVYPGTAVLVASSIWNVWPRPGANNDAHA